MELAKRLLQEKKISVTETAYRLGYEKVSAFICMFKKLHNVLPGSLNKPVARFSLGPPSCAHTSNAI